MFSVPMAPSVLLIQLPAQPHVWLRVRRASVAVGVTSSVEYSSTTTAGVTLHLANIQSATMHLMVK